MPPALKVKQFGLPRWVWLVAIAGGVGVGLYIRAKKAEQVQTDATAVGDGTASPDPTAADAMQYNGLDGLPVGYYDALSGNAGTSTLPDTATIPDAVDPNTNGQPIINITLPDGSQKAARVKGPAGKRGKPGKPGKHGPSGSKGGAAGGGGPPKRPQHKPKPPRGSGMRPLPAPIGGGGGGHKKKKK